MSQEKLYFSTIEESRGQYYVEYRPPAHGYRLASLQLIYTSKVELEEVAKTMELEAQAWLARYPVPIMVSAFDETGHLYHLEGVRSESHLISFVSPDRKDPKIHWRLLKDEEIPSDALSREYLLQVYRSIGRKTSSDLRRKAEQNAKKIRIGWYVVFTWAAIVPAIIALLEFFSPQWVAVLVLLYGLTMAAIKALKLLGRWGKSPQELAKEEEERRMKHHHYHCERNPDGFLRLKLENFERWERESILKAADSLKNDRSETGYS